MSLPIVLRAEAEAEFDEAFDFYDDRRPGLGSEFVTAVQNVFDSLSANPLIHQVVFADIRKAVVLRFPYCVFYQPHAYRVEVLAVFHSSRDPTIWQSRA